MLCRVVAKTSCSSALVFISGVYNWKLSFLVALVHTCVCILQQSFSVFTVIGAKAIPILVWCEARDHWWYERSFEGSQNYLGKPAASSAQVIWGSRRVNSSPPQRMCITFAGSLLVVEQQVAITHPQQHDPAYRWSSWSDLNLENATASSSPCRCAWAVLGKVDPQTGCG